MYMAGGGGRSVLAYGRMGAKGIEVSLRSTSSHIRSDLHASVLHVAITVRAQQRAVPGARCTVKTSQRILSIRNTKGFNLRNMKKFFVIRRKFFTSLRMLKILRNTKHILRIMKKSFVRF